MGYRVRLGKINKQDAEWFRDRTYEDLNDYFTQRQDYFYRPNEHTELYEIGKYIDFNAICTESEPFYTKFNVYEMEEGEFIIITRNDLVAIINEYSKWNEEYFTGLWTEFKDAIEKAGDERVIKNGELVGKLASHLSSKQHAWDTKWKLEPVKCEPSSDGEMTGSWLHEYAIFNLVHILKTFDWENDYLIYSGW